MDESSKIWGSLALKGVSGIKGFLERVDALHRRWPWPIAMVLSCTALALLCLAHASFHGVGAVRTLYLLPIWLAIRLDGKRAGMCMVLVACAAMVIEDILRIGRTDPNLVITDGFFRLLAFSGVAWIISGVESRLALTQMLALHDPLTGVYNRRALSEYWANVTSGGGHPGQYVVVMIDCDGFKTVNDQFGHDAGDRVLQMLGTILETETRHSDLVARVGGDEFVLVLKGISPNEAKGILQRVEHVFESTVAHAGYSCTISVGFAPVESAEDTIESLLRKADRAMYARKEVKKATAFLN